MIKKIQNNDEEMLVICSSIDAKYLLANSSIPKEILVITDVVPIGEITLVPKEEFIKYLSEGIKE